jgi:hypothetical protein
LCVEIHGCERIRPRCRHFCKYCLCKTTDLISNFRRVLKVVCFLLGNAAASEIYMPTFRKTLFHLHRRICTKKYFHTHPPMKMEQTECSETSAYKIQTPGNCPEESVQQICRRFDVRNISNIGTLRKVLLLAIPDFKLTVSKPL